MNIARNLLGIGVMGAGIATPKLLTANAAPDVQLIALAGGICLMGLLLATGLLICRAR